MPPGNSAATQYTQVFPTTGGNVAVGTSLGETGNGGKKSPSKVIGKETAEELESQGSEGKAVAQLAAESAPEPTGEAETSESSSGGAAGGDKPSGGNSGGATPAGTGKGAKAGGGAATGNPGDGAATAPAGSGSSGFSEVLGQATGASSGAMGIFLPLVLLAALVLAAAYVWRQRRHEQEAAS